MDRTDIKNFNGKERLIRKKAESDLSTFLFGRVPPQNREMEEVVLGALMLESDSYERVNRLLRADCFYVQSHQQIYAAIVRLKEKGIPVDLMTVTEDLRHAGDLESVGGAYFVTEITNRVASGANIEAHAQVIFEKYMQREIIRISSEAVKDAFEDTTDCFELHQRTMAAIQAVSEPVIAARETPLKKQLQRLVDRIEEAKENPGQHTLGTPSGFKSLDALINGFLSGDLNIIAARSGHGKTSLSLCIARNMIMAGKAVDIYSLETNDQGLLMKFCSGELGVPYTDIQHGHVDWESLLKFQSEFGELPLSIQDTTNVYIEDLVARARLRKRQFGVQVIFIDYLQLLGCRSLNRNANREQEVAYISRSLKTLAKDHDIAVIALCQINRTVDESADKRPKIGSLRESSAIEFDADKVILLWRPAHNKVLYDADGYSTAGVAMLDVAKHRNGSTGITKLQWHPATTKFSEFPPGWSPDFEASAVTKKKKKSGYGNLIPLKDITESNREADEPPLPF